MELTGKKIFILVETIHNDLEFWYPYYRLKEAEERSASKAKSRATTVLDQAIIALQANGQHALWPLGKKKEER